MQVQDLKRWHWLMIAVVVGGALSYAWSSLEWDESLPNIGQRDFEGGLTIPFPREGHLANVTVLPPREGKHTVVAEIVRNTPTPGVVELRPVVYVAEVPYLAGLWRGEADEFRNVREYLATLRANNPEAEISYRYAWWRETWAIYVLMTGASVLLIGGVWPSVVSLMVGAGLGLQREEKGPEYDLDRFKGEGEKKPDEKRAPTPEELEHLRQLEQELEKKLEAQRLGVPIPEDQPAEQPAEVRKLDGGPLEAAAVTAQQEEHEYRGEFYPVDRGAKKK